MKKYIFYIACMLLMGVHSVYSQETVPNGSFENWTGYNPDGWLGLLNSATFQNVLESSDAQSGSHSVELRVAYYPLLSSYVYASLMVMDFIPVSSRPGALNGYFKGTAAGSDSLTLMITLYKNETPVGYGFFFTSQDAANWTSFSAPIAYYSDEIPDEAYIVVYAGQDLNSSDGTVYFLDNLTFSETAGMDDLAAAENFSLYPNPAGNVLNVSFSINESDNFIFEMITPQGISIPVSGKVALQRGKNSVQLYTASLAPGIYFLNAHGEKYQSIGKVMIK